MDICERFGFSSQNAAHDHLACLARKHVICFRPGAKRGYIMLPPWSEYIDTNIAPEAAA